MQGKDQRLREKGIVIDSVEKIKEADIHERDRKIDVNYKNIFARCSLTCSEI